MDKNSSDDYKRGYKDGYFAALNCKRDSSIGSGTACILVKDSSLKNSVGDAPFYAWLKQNGFTKWQIGHGYYNGIDWVFVNLNSKLFNPGMPGIKLTEPICDHAITIEEFKTIYAIFDKYKGKSILEF